MTRADMPRFARMVEDLCLAFARPKDPQLTEVYWLGLANLGIDDIQRAVNRAIAEGQRMPPVAELRRFAAQSSLPSAEQRTDATMASKYRCSLHRERPLQVQIDYNWWCDCCRRHGDRDPERTARQVAEINEWAAEWRAGRRDRWTEKQPKIVTGNAGRDWTSDYMPPEVEQWIGTSGE